MAEQQALLVEALKEITNKEKPRIKDYDGNQDIEQWFAIFDFQTEGKSDPEKLRLLSGHLTDGTETWFFTKKNRDITPATITEWKRRMIEHFSVPKQIVRNKLKDRKLESSEDYMKYMQDVNRLCDRLSKTMDDDERLHHLEKGLTAYYKEKMMVMRPKNVKEFETYMKELVAKSPKAPTMLESPQLFVEAIAKAISKGKSKIEESALLTNENNGNNNHRNNDQYDDDRQINDFRNNGGYRSNGYHRNNISQNRMHPYMHPMFGYRKNEHHHFHGNCNNCGRFGHKAADCFAPLDQSEQMDHWNPPSLDDQQDTFDDNWDEVDDSV